MEATVDAPERLVGFTPRSPHAGELAKTLSTDIFNPPPEAEPEASQEDKSTHPTVLSKLQKWVSAGRRGGRPRWREALLQQPARPSAAVQRTPQLLPTWRLWHARRGTIPQWGSRCGPRGLCP